MFKNYEMIHPNIIEIANIPYNNLIAEVSKEIFYTQFV